MDRDRSMDTLLRDALGRQSPTGPCLDAETAAAWADGALSDTDRRSAEAHAASCARCQAMLAAIVRTSPPPQRSLFSGFRLPSAAWAPLGTLAAAAAAFVIWIVVPSQQKPVPAPSSAATVAKTPAPAGAPPAAAATTELRSAGARQNPVQAQSRSRLDAKGSAPAKNERAFDRFQAEANKLVPAKQKDQEEAQLKKENAPAAAVVDRLAVAKSAVAPAPPPAASPAAAPAARAAATPPAPAEPKRDAAAGAAGGTVAGSVAEAVTVAPPPLAAQNSVAADSARRAAPVGPWTIVASPDRAVQWRLFNPPGPLSRTTIQRSIDGGTTWRPQVLEAGTTVTSGAAPSANVCWLAGPGGTVVRTTNGVAWTRVAFPESVDLVAVRATDQNNATVTTADGRTFTTIDGGTSWKR